MLFKKQLDCLDMIIENLDSYLDELLTNNMDRAKIFQSVIKGTNVFILLLIAIILLVIILLNLVVLKKIINTGYIIEKLIVLVLKVRMV